VTELSAANGFVVPTNSMVGEAESVRRRAGQHTVMARLKAQQVDLDLGGTTVRTWAYGDAVPGPLIRATAGDLVTVQVSNALPTSGSGSGWSMRARTRRSGSCWAATG
jgi:FtsP/CotA-like multicopper oxidase with cupredoxin domain